MKKYKRFVLGGIAIISMAMLLAGCVTVGPDYTPPDMKAPEQWTASPAGEAGAPAAKALSGAEWWRGLGDPILTGLIERAVEGNLDIRTAESRVRQARAQRGVASADLYPTLEGSGSATRSKSSGSDETRDMFALGFDSGWEIDIFGGVRRSKEAATADYEAAEEDLRDVMVSLTAEVALNYYEFRVYQKKLEVAQNNLKVQKETFELTDFRYRAGLVDALDLEKARYNLEDTRSNIPAIRTGLEESLNSLAVLLGVYPGSLQKELSDTKPIQVAPLKIAVGIPAEVLLNRPDVRSAERALAAQSARVGVATSELYPKISLLGSIGLEALSSDDLFMSDSSTFSFGPRLSWNLFNAGAVRRSIEVQDEILQQTMIEYEATILSALEEVENSLVSYAQEQKRLESLERATQAAKRAVELAMSEYSSGMVDFQDVLETQRSLLSFETQLVESKANVLMNLIRLYKALGGGWENSEEINPSLQSLPQK